MAAQLLFADDLCAFMSPLLIFLLPITFHHRISGFAYECAQLLHRPSAYVAVLSSAPETAVPFLQATDSRFVPLQKADAFAILVPQVDIFVLITCANEETSSSTSLARCFRTTC